MTSKQTAERRVIRTVMRSFDRHVREAGGAEALFATSYTREGRELILACVALANSRRSK